MDTGRVKLCGGSALGGTTNIPFWTLSVKVLLAAQLKFLCKVEKINGDQKLEQRNTLDNMSRSVNREGSRVVHSSVGKVCSRANGKSEIFFL